MSLIEDRMVGNNRLGLWKIDGSEVCFEADFPEVAASLSVRHPRTQL